MANFTAMVSRVQSLAGSHSLATSTVVGGFINSRHDELLHAHMWHRRKSEIFLASAADYTTGTVTLTNASATITGSGTTWTSAMTGRYVRVGDSLYRFTYVSGTSGTLSDWQGNALSYPGSTESGLSYVMFKRFYSLGSAIDQILSINYQSRITERAQEYFDAIDPTRVTTGIPEHFCYAERDQSSTNDLVQIELFPRPTEALSFTALVMKGHSELSGTTNPIVPSPPIEWFAAVDTCFYLFAKTKEQKWMDLATVYHKKGEGAFDDAKNEDAKQFGRNRAVMDTIGGVGLESTDFGITHDVGF